MSARSRPKHFTLSHSFVSAPFLHLEIANRNDFRRRLRSSKLGAACRITPLPFNRRKKEMIGYGRWIPVDAVRNSYTRIV